MHTSIPTRPLVVAAVLLVAMAGSATAANFALPDASPAGHPQSVAGKAYASGVIVDSRSSGTATVGRPFPVTIDFSQVAPGGAKVSFTSDAFLALGQARARTLSPGSSSITLTVTPSANGLGFINVFTRQGTGGSVISIPVQVGPPEAAPRQDANLKTGLDGRPVKLLPVP